LLKPYKLATTAERVGKNMQAKSHLVHLSDLVGSIYDCIPDASLWEMTLDHIRSLCQGCIATLAVHELPSGLTRFSVACGEKALLEPLQLTGSGEMIFYSAVPKMELDVPQTVDTVYQLQGPGMRQEWLSSRMALDWAIPNEIDDFIWLPVMKQAGRVGSLLVITRKERPQISAHDLHLVSQLAPHMRRAVTIGDLFETERRRGEIFRDIVDCLSHPVLIVSADMQIIFANLAAETLLQEKLAIKSLRGQLTFPFSHAQKAIASAVEAGQRNEFSLGPSGINVPLSNSDLPSVAHVMPLKQRDPSVRISQNAAAAIFIASPGHAPVPAMDAIAALFGLTAAEKRVATQIAAGRSRQEIALSSGVSDGTVKTQLASIFDKTDTHDQRGLELLLRDLTPATRTH
jgi:DNA-binding CsgD family transcriptional regulator/PAS domain-containing protein